MVPRMRMGVELSKSVHDPPAIQVVWRDLDPHTITEHEADAVSLQPPGEVAEHLVPVVELDAEHPATQGLRHLTLQLKLLFLLVNYRPVR